MKKIKIMAPAAVLLAALALGGCGRVAAAAREPDEQTEKSAETVRETRENGAELYQIRIAELENELRQLRASLPHPRHPYGGEGGIGITHPERGFEPLHRLRNLRIPLSVKAA